MATSAILLAAGCSSRMGAFKPLLPVWAGAEPATVLERNVRLFREAGIEDIHVVVGHRAEELEAPLAALGLQPVPNPRYREGMLASVVAGLDSLDAGVDRCFVLPVDIPLVRPGTLKALVRAEAPVVFPTFRGERGHPPLIALALRDAIRAWTGGGGLRGFLAGHEASAVEVAVADEGILRDIDTPADYAKVLARSAHLEIPSLDECHGLLDLLQVPRPIRNHGELVARVAALLDAELHRAGQAGDSALLTAAGLLHDLARAEPDHAGRGARILRDLGFERVADLVACHMDFALDEAGPIGPEEVLYFADKLSLEDRVVTLQERFQRAFERHTQEAAAMLKAAGRFRIAQAIQSRLEKAMDRSVADLLKAL